MDPTHDARETSWSSTTCRTSCWSSRRCSRSSARTSSCARSGAEALQHLLEREFAVILLDVNMPDIDGFETAALIRQRKRSAHTPIIFVTAYADEMQTIRGYSLGAVDYILSPVVPEVLRSQGQGLRRPSPGAAKAAPPCRRAGCARRRRGGAFGRRGEHEALELPVAGEPAAQRIARSRRPPRAGSCELLVPRLRSTRRRSRSATSRAILAGRPRLARPCPAARCRIAPSSGVRAQVRRGRVVAQARSPTPPAPCRRRPRRGPLRPALDRSPRRAVGVLALRTVGRATTTGIVLELAERSGDRARERAPIPQPCRSRSRSGASVEALLQASNRRKDEFLAMLAHELRNPLAPIRTAVELIRRLAPAEPQARPGPRDVIERQVDAPGAAGRRPARRVAHHPGQDRAAGRAARPARRRRRTRSRPRGPSSTAARPPARASSVPDAPVVRARRRRAPRAGGRQPAQQRRQVHRRGRQRSSCR